MEHYNEQIRQHTLFAGIQPENITPMLSCIGGFIKTYRKGEIILLSDESVRNVGMILKGTVHMVKEDIDGNTSLLAALHTDDIFGETFACGSLTDSRVTFLCAVDADILFLPFYKVLHTCSNACMFHHKLIENMVRLICDKNIRLMEKIEVTSKRTIREKILAYLHIQYEKQQINPFEISLSRLEMADYLCVHRSALTRELSAMRDDGIIDYHKNTFELK